MNHIYDVCESEDGIAFIGGDGIFYFQDSIARTKSPYNTSQGTFRDDGTPQKYIHPELKDDDTFIYNEADISGDGIVKQVVLDDVLQLEQGPRAVVRDNSLLFSSDDAFNQAYILVEKYKTSILRCDQLLVKPQADAINLYPLVMGWEISTRLTFLLNSTINPAMVNKDYHVEGVTHEWSMIGNEPNLWKTKWQLWNVAKVYVCPATHDGLVTKSGETDDDYITVHDAPQGSAYWLKNDSADPLQAGQHPYIGFYETYRIDRSVIEFDISKINPSWTVASGKMALRLSGSAALHDKTEFDLTIVKATLVSSMPITIDTYGDLLPMLVDLGHVTIVGGEVTGPTFQPYVAFIELNATGIAYLQAAVTGGTGLVRFALRSDHDMTATPPINGTAGWDEYVFIDSKNGTGFKPRLFVEVS